MPEQTRAPSRASDTHPTGAHPASSAPAHARIWLRALGITVVVTIMVVGAMAQGALLTPPLHKLLLAAAIEGALVGVMIAVLFVVAPARRAEADRQWLIANLRELAKVDRRKTFGVLLERVESHAMGEIVQACHDALTSAHRDRLEAATLRKEMDSRVHRKTKQAVAQISRMSNLDELSGLQNRRGFEGELSDAFAASVRSLRPLSLLAIDLDNFKQLNDTLGHAKGDEAIRAAGEILSSTLRDGDVAGRMGGDEFMVLLRDTDTQAAGQIALRCMRLFASHPAGGGLSCPWPTMSIGIACGRDHAADSASRLKELADEALYDAKHAGRNAYCILGQKPQTTARAA